MKTLLLSLGLCLLLGSCVSNQVTSTAALQVSPEQFASFQTWSWSPDRSLNLRDPSRNADQVRGCLESAITESLAKKGLQPAASTSSDLLVRYGAGSLQRLDVQNVAFPGRGESSRYDHSPDPLVPTGVRSTEWEEGRLLIQILNRRTGTVVYSGFATAALLTDPSPSRSEARIRKAVEDIFAKLPR